jgi:hypothetical protein
MLKMIKKINMSNYSKLCRSVGILTRFVFGLLIVFGAASHVDAASLAVSPSTAVYTSGQVFTVNIVVNTDGKSVNAAEGSLSFNPNELSVVSVDRNNSIFNLWVAEPAFSNSAGTISFSGGLPSGYSGRVGTIMSVTFRAVGSGAVRANFRDGSVLANDGRGTNILTSMNGGTYTIQTASVAPEPEVIEYIAPANTPAQPDITSNTHGDSTQWHSSNKAVLSWTIPNDVIEVRTLLNENPTTVPTKVYDPPIRTITLEDLPEGVSYFHLQFRNEDGWGRVNHYRLAVDTEKPSSIDIYQSEDVNHTNPVQKLVVDVVDDTSVVRFYKVQVREEDPFEYIDETGSSTITLPTLAPGSYSVFVEAFDEAGNSIIGTYSFIIESFAKPVFTEYPTQINEEVIPVIKGETRPNATVEVQVNRVGAEPNIYSLMSDENGQFIFIPEGTLQTGVYELRAQAVDAFDAQSEMSDTIRIAVQQPGYLRIGSLIVSVLSVIIPLLVMIFMLGIGVWYLFIIAKRFRRKVGVESQEALEILHKEFSELKMTLHTQETEMQNSRKTKKLTKAETEMIEVMDRALQTSQQKVEKEIADITELTRKK